MSFNYDKISAKDGDHGSWWTSYADLFMMLSIVFLLMYVTSSLRNGSAGLQQQTEYKQLAKHAEDLEQQIKVYNTLKEQQLQSAGEEEQKVYQKLMSQLSMLRDEAKDEKEALTKKAKENADKEFALNEYQHLVQSIINTNLIAKSQIKNRDEKIVQTSEQLDEAQETIEQKTAEQQQLLVSLEHQKATLAQEKARFEANLKHQKISAAARAKKLAAFAAENERKRRSLEGELTGLRGKIRETESQLTSATQTIEQQKAEQSRLQAAIERQRATQAQEKARFEANLNHQKISAAVRAKKMAAYAAETERKRQQLEGSLAGLQGRIKKAETDLAGAEAGKAQAEAEKGRALAAVGSLKGDLARAQALNNAKKQLAHSIAESLGKAGVKGNVDERTGEVTLDFGEEYFDTGRTDLKPKMVATLDKFVPMYSRSLFSDPKIADKIASVEIVGFASSTYQGHYVNPKSIRPEDKEAIDYNLKLSFGRANSIFKHILNKNSLTQAEQERLFPLMKVVGRGYLPEGKDADKASSGISEKEFCKRFNCQKAQRVILKFNMKD